MTYMDGGNAGNAGNNWQWEIEGLFQTIFRLELHNAPCTYGISASLHATLIPLIVMTSEN